MHIFVGKHNLTTLSKTIREEDGQKAKRGIGLADPRRRGVGVHGLKSQPFNAIWKRRIEKEIEITA